MANSTYKINKGINKSIEFKGLRAQYIWYLGGGVMVLLILFSIMYIIGVNTYIGLIIILAAGTYLVFKIYAMSAKYGEFGLMKEMAKRIVPKYLKCNSRDVFFIKKGGAVINRNTQTHNGGRP